MIPTINSTDFKTLKTLIANYPVQLKTKEVGNLAIELDRAKIVEDEAILGRFFRQVILTTQIEHTEFLEILHRAISFDVNGPPGMERPHACDARRA